MNAAGLAACALSRQKARATCAKSAVAIAGAREPLATSKNHRWQAVLRRAVLAKRLALGLA